MHEKIEITNFAGIDKMELELGAINIILVPKHRVKA